MRRMLLILCLSVAASVAPASSVAARVDSPAQMRAVVRAWSARLNAGDNNGDAKLFALPALIVQGPYAYRLVTADQIALWHSFLPCSGSVVSIAVKGRYATAVFRLGSKRPGLKCDDPGGEAAARFEIRGGKIHRWEQIPVPGAA